MTDTDLTTLTWNELAAEFGRTHIAHQTAAAALDVSSEKHEALEADLEATHDHRWEILEEVTTRMIRTRDTLPLEALELMARMLRFVAFPIDIEGSGAANFRALGVFLAVIYSRRYA
jgi:hypothetical protein